MRERQCHVRGEQPEQMVSFGSYAEYQQYECNLYSRVVSRGVGRECEEHVGGVAHMFKALSAKGIDEPRRSPKHAGLVAVVQRVAAVSVEGSPKEN